MTEVREALFKKKDLNVCRLERTDSVEKEGQRRKLSEGDKFLMR